MIKWDQNRCDLCGLCVCVCPENVFEMFEKYLTIDQDKCINCEKCSIICPVTALSIQSKEAVND
ncbi:MAG: 4Fe-4S binding protein [Candidatus Marinimicrobia bacterium]|nr:4Fe-4S binding protein [Candidatus Neomarinimicrobiota bacterium]